jgi:purine nucleoside phosphorylase
MSEFTLPAAFQSAKPAVGIVLGSGLGGLVDLLGNAKSFDYAEIGGLPVGSVEGHAGKLHLGTLGGVEGRRRPRPRSYLRGTHRP